MTDPRTEEAERIPGGEVALEYSETEVALRILPGVSAAFMSWPEALAVANAINVQAMARGLLGGSYYDTKPAHRTAYDTNKNRGVDC